MVLEAIDQRVEHAARFCRIVEDRERPMHMDRGEIPRWHRLCRLFVPGRRHVCMRAVENRDRTDTANMLPMRIRAREMADQPAIAVLQQQRKMRDPWLRGGRRDQRCEGMVADQPMDGRSVINGKRLRKMEGHSEPL